MVQRLIVLLALVVLSASSSKSQALPPLNVVNPYDILSVRPFTGNPAYYQSQATIYKDFIRKYPSLGKYQQTDSEVEATFDNAVKNLSDPVSKYQWDFAIAEAKSKILDYHEALGVPFGAPAAEIASRVWDIEQALDIPLTYNTPREAARVKAILSHFREIRDRVTSSPEDRANYDAYIKQQYVEEMQKRISASNPLGEKDLSAFESGGRWLVSFGAGNVGFMVGNTFELMLKGWINNDLATQWAAWDTWRDFNGLSSLVMFGAGAEATNKIYQAMASKYLEEGPNAHTNYGMMVGTITSHLWGKFISDGEHEIFVNNWKQNQGLIKQWGETVAEKEYNKKQAFAYIYLIMHHNPNDPKVIEAKKNLEEIATATDKANKDIAKYRSAFYTSLGREVWNTATHWKREELEQLAISMGRMFITVKTLDWVDTLIDGLYARWVMADKYKIFGHEFGPENQKHALEMMSPEERAHFDQIAQSVKLLEEQEATYGVAAGDIKSLAKELQGASAEKIRLIKAKYWKYLAKKVNDSIDSTLEGGNPLFTIPAKKGRSMISSLKNYFWPEVTGDMEITSSLGRRVFIGHSIMGFFNSIPSAVKFLALDQFIEGVRVDGYNTSLLHMRLERRMTDVNEAIATFMNSPRLDNSPELIRKISEALDSYDDVWGKYREQVISRPSTEALAEWNKMRETPAHENYLASQWLNWFIRGSSLQDPDFKANGGGDPNKVWHVDNVEFSVPFEEQKNKYGKLLKSPFNAVETQKKVNDLQDTEDDFEFHNAVVMHKRLRPLVLNAFFGAQAPLWREGLNFGSDIVLKGVNMIGDMLQGGGISGNPMYAPIINIDPNMQTLDQRIAAVQKDYSEKRIELPNNWFDAYVVQFQYLHQKCGGILAQLPSTPLVVQFRKLCSIPNPILVGNSVLIGTYAQADGYAAFANSALVKAEQEYYAKFYTGFINRGDATDRGDTVALTLLSALQKNLFNLFNLKQRYDAILNQPESEADVQKAKTAAEQEENKKKAILKQQAVAEDHVTEHFLGLDQDDSVQKSQSPAPSPTPTPPPTLRRFEIPTNQVKPH